MALQEILSIRLRPGGFSFYTYNVLEEDSFSRTEVDVAPGVGSNERLQDSIFAHEELLRDYQEVHCTVATTRFTVVPPELDDECAEEMFRLVCGKTDQPECLLHEREGEIHVIYALDEALHLFLTRTFQGIRFHHPLCTLHSHFAEKCKMGNQAKMVVHVQRGDQEILVYRKGRLQLANLYHEELADNILYYVLNTWTQCKMDQNADHVLLCGDRELQKQLTDGLQPIVRQTMPAVFPAGFFRLGQLTLEAPWDTLLLTHCQK
jgi:hypothetical protein